MSAPRCVLEQRGGRTRARCLDCDGDGVAGVTRAGFERWAELHRKAFHKPAGPRRRRIEARK